MPEAVPSFEECAALLAGRMREFRERGELSQERLALESGVDRTFVSQIERAVGNPSLRTLCKLADRLGVPVWALITPQNTV